MLTAVPRVRVRLAIARSWPALLAAFLCGGCMRAYQPPTADQPHAILKMRRTYEKTAGTQLTEVVQIGDAVGYRDTSLAETAVTPKNDAILIHLVPTDLTVRSQFTHQYTHLVLEHYNEQQSYQTTESYSCGFGASQRTCTRPTTQYRSVPKTRWVNRTETVVDGSCERALRLSPKRGSSYLLQYTYQDSFACSLSCFEQIAADDGSIGQVPCAP